MLRSAYIRGIKARLMAVAVVLLLHAVANAETMVTLTTVGTPTWRPVDFHLFTAPSQPSSAASNTVSRILTPPNHILSSGVILPGTAHAGPYDQEIRAGLAALRIPDMTYFSKSDYSGSPNGIWLALMLVPGPGSPMGSTPDFANGPIIPEATFPITDTVQILRNGQPFDSALIRTRPLSQLTPPLSFDGSSHRPQFFFTDLSTADNPQGLSVADLPGRYTILLSLRDAQGNGYNGVVNFEVVVPEPTSWALLGTGMVGLMAWRKGRRRK